MDIKYNCVNGFKFISLTEKEYFVRDRPEDCVYTALISCLPKNQIMLNCINKIVENIAKLVIIKHFNEVIDKDELRSIANCKAWALLHSDYCDPNMNMFNFLYTGTDRAL
jgi:hypothetical protein